MKQAEAKNFKSQNNDGVSLNYRFVTTSRLTRIQSSFLGNVMFTVNYHVENQTEIFSSLVPQFLKSTLKIHIKKGIFVIH